MYLVGCRGRSEVEGIIVVVGLVVSDKGGEVVVVVYVKDQDGLCREWGRVLSWQALRMV